jgi:hypothetical protein
LGRRHIGTHAALPTPVANTYGGIDRATVAAWRTGFYNGAADFGAATSDLVTHIALVLLAGWLSFGGEISEGSYAKRFGKPLWVARLFLRRFNLR